MADDGTGEKRMSNGKTNNSEKSIPPWASGEDLRHVEKDVLIPKIMRERARTEKCRDLVEAFSKCAKGRTISTVWACRQENKVMKDCLTKYFLDKDFYDECKKEYLSKRSEYQQQYAKSGKIKEMKKKEAVI